MIDSSITPGDSDYKYQCQQRGTTRRRLQVVSSVGVISYGWDCPAVSCAVLARPTASLALHLQQCGRVLRPYPPPAVTTPGLRDYQIADLDKLRAAIRAGHRRILLTQPTGSGKGYLAVHMIRQTIEKGNRALFLVNRRTLVLDLSRRLDREGLDHGIIMGNHRRRKPWCSVHVASIDTLHRREQLPPYDIAFLDEAHFSISPTWLSVVERLGDIPLIGMTATPIRADGAGLGRMYDLLVEGPTVAELQDRGYLVQARVFAPSRPNLRGVSVTAGDYNQKELAAAVDKPRLVGNIVDHWLRLGERRPTVVFATSIEHSKHIVASFQERGIEATHVDADTPDDVRDATWDDLTWWASPKRDAIILDHAGNTINHGFVDEDREWSLDDSGPLRKQSEAAISVCRCVKCYYTFRTGPAVCPACGAPIPRERRSVREEDGYLEELRNEARARSKEEWRASCDEDKRAALYRQWQERARAKGYKPMWARVKFKTIFGYWPRESGKAVAQ